MDAILTGKELESVKQHLSNKISSGIKEHFQVQKSIKESKGFEEFSQNETIAKMIQEQQNKLAENLESSPYASEIKARWP